MFSFVRLSLLLWFGIVRAKTHTHSLAHSPIISPFSIERPVLMHFPPSLVLPSMPLTPCPLLSLLPVLFAIAPIHACIDTWNCVCFTFVVGLFWFYNPQSCSNALLFVISFGFWLTRCVHSLPALLSHSVLLLMDSLSTSSSSSSCLFSKSLIFLPGVARQPRPLVCPRH